MKLTKKDIEVLQLAAAGRNLRLQDRLENATDPTWREFLVNEIVANEDALKKLHTLRAYATSNE